MSEPTAPECDDYEYDLAHDEPQLPGARRPEDERPVRVDVPADEASGDYGYDMAHDVR
jgi:hypothetical protein